MADYSIHINRVRANLSAGKTNTEEWSAANFALKKIEEHLSDVDRRLRALESRG